MTLLEPSQTLSDLVASAAATRVSTSKVSIVIVTANRLPVLQSCLSAVRQQQCGRATQVIVGCNDDADTAEWLRINCSWVTVVELQRLPLGAARNRLLPHATGDLILFLDDDTVAPTTLVRDLTTIAELHPDVDVFGGPNTTADTTSAFVNAQDDVLRSRHLGPVRHRFRPESTSNWALCLCNLAIRRRVGIEFSDDVTAGEETELLARLRLHGHRFLVDPDLAVVHQRRSTLRSFTRQMFKYGHGRGQATPLAAPAAFLVGALAVTLAGAASARFAPTEAPMAMACVAASYATAVTYTAGRAAFAHRNVRRAAWSVAIIPATHAAYATGLFSGTARTLRNRLADR